jgi:hypothetical protein
MPTQIPGYDDAEALDLLSRLADKHAPDLSARGEAVERLLDALVNVNGRVKRVRFIRSPGASAVRVVVNNLAVEVVHDGYGGVEVYDRAGSKETVPLVYNATKAILESENLDTFRTPKPGEPVQRRSALAEVLEVALRVLNAL